MNRAEAEQFLQTHTHAVLATIRRDGRPQLSNVLAVYDGGRLLISITETRAKYHNLKRDPRATVLILGDNFWQYLTVDGTAEFLHMPEALQALRDYYVKATGKEHPNWAEYDEAMAREKRVLVSITIQDMYPLSA